MNIDIPLVSLEIAYMSYRTLCNKLIIEDIDDYDLLFQGDRILWIPKQWTFWLNNEHALYFLT